MSIAGIYPHPGAIIKHKSFHLKNLRCASGLPVTARCFHATSFHSLFGGLKGKKRTVGGKSPRRRSALELRQDGRRIDRSVPVSSKPARSGVERAWRSPRVGPEDVLVLTGGYADQFGTFEAGAYGSYAPGTEHRPFTEPDEECWTLLRLETPNQFRGWRGWMQRLLS